VSISEPLSFRLEGLAAEAFDQFSDAGDYFWKSARFLDDELLRELKKIADYYPLSGDPESDRLALKLGEVRWSREQKKAKGAFSFLISAGNLFTSVSMLEQYLFRMCKEIEASPSNQGKLLDVRGNGVDRYFRYLRIHSVKPESIPFFHEILAIITLRNCVYHANGLLELSREAGYVRRIVEQKLYYEPINQVGKRREDRETLATVIMTGQGEQVRVGALLAWHSTHFFSNFVCQLCKNSL
jgi:hypothetical protein